MSTDETPPPEPGSRGCLRSCAIAALSLVALIVFIIVGLPAIGDFMAARELAAARERWSAAEIGDYTMRIRHGGFCPSVDRTVTVRGGVATIEDAVPEMTDYAGRFDWRSVEQVFDVIGGNGWHPDGYDANGAPQGDLDTRGDWMPVDSCGTSLEVTVP